MSTSSKLPIVVDLDETLVRTDTLIEEVMSKWHSAPATVLKSIINLPLSGRVTFKERINKEISLDPKLLPYNYDLIDFLKQEKNNGREIYLATASHVSMANTIATHIDIFDGVFATDNEVNLKGSKKAEFLTRRFGEKGFIYAGDSKADLPVWAHAESAILVSASNSLKKRIQTPILIEFSRENIYSQILKQMRVYQWIKNILVFVPMIAAGQLASSFNLLAAFICFLAFSFTASGVYILNDLLDLESDRKHHRKRTRPFASGSLSLQAGLLVSPLLFIIGLLLSYLVDPVLTAVIFGYFILTTWYSVHLKTLPLVDVFTLAALYSVRIVGGGVSTDTLPSTWLLSFSGCLFLSLAFLKRYIENSAAEENNIDLSRRGYDAGESMIQMNMGIAASFSSVIVFSIWLDSATFHQTYSNQLLLWLVTPLILLWQCRLWLAAFRKKMHDDPIVYTAKDRISWMIFGLSGVLYSLGLTI